MNDAVITCDASETLIDQHGQQWEVIPDPREPLLERPDLPDATRDLIVDWLARLALAAALRQLETDGASPNVEP
jgi:hypothetical protein